MFERYAKYGKQNSFCAGLYKAVKEAFFAFFVTRIVLVATSSNRIIWI